MSGISIETLTVEPPATPTPSPTGTPTATPTATSTDTPTDTSSETTTRTPGFGVATAVAGIGSAVGYLLYSNKDADQ